MVVRSTGPCQQGSRQGCSRIRPTGCRQGYEGVGRGVDGVLLAVGRDVHEFVQQGVDMVNEGVDRGVDMGGLLCPMGASRAVSRVSSHLTEQCMHLQHSRA